MANDIDYYLSKVPPLHVGRPKFRATLALTLQPFVDQQAFLEALPQAFDIDTAIGVQLDAVGGRLGRTRAVPIPLQNIYFTWGDPLRGWGRGIWKNSDLNPGVTYANLDDDVFRRMLKAVALSNEWDGTVVGGQLVLDEYFPPGLGTFVFIQNRGWGVSGGSSINMSMTIAISGKIPSVVDLEVLRQNLLGLEPAGVKVDYAVTSVDGAPIFGWGVDNDYIGGWGRGAWAISTETILLGDAGLEVTN
jgi:hypothetical protein